MNKSTRFAWDARIAEQNGAAMERHRRRMAGLPVYHSEVVLSGRSSGFVAKRGGVCQLCRDSFFRGDSVRPVGAGRYAHHGCVEAEVVRRSKAAPAARVSFVQRLSEATELRRRVFWAVACPECGAAEGKWCVVPSGQRRVRNHVQRMHAYSAAKRAKKVVSDGYVLQRLREALRGVEGFDMAAVVARKPEVVHIPDPMDWEVEWACMRT